MTDLVSLAVDGIHDKIIRRLNIKPTLQESRALWLSDGGGGGPPPSLPQPPPPQQQQQQTKRTSERTPYIPLFPRRQT
jgi:hypothetical protein